MSGEENKALARRFYAVFNSGNSDELDYFVAADYAQHSVGLPPGLAGLKMFMGMFRAAFPDARLIVEDLLADGDRVIGRWTVTGTQTGALQGIPASGKAVNIGGIDIWRVADGKLAEHWDNWDQMGMMQQIGAMPAPAQGG